MAVTKRTNSLSGSDEELIQQYKDDWARAKAAGDKAGMEQAHANAEAVRSKYGYSGGDDGDDYIPKLSGGFTSSSKKNSSEKSPVYVETEMPTFDMDSIGTRPTFDMESIGTRPSYDWQEILGEKPTYTSKYDTQIDALLGEILNREKFSYSAETDPLYQQYKTMYNREGTRAMKDTLATVASGAGGMNSYAMTAAQQANDYYSAKLGDMMPELYQMAYDMYLSDLGGKRDDLSMLQGAERDAYNKYLDSLSQYNNDRSFSYGAYRDEVGDWRDNRDFLYGAYRDQVGDYENDRDFAYGAYRDQMGDYMWGTEFNYGAERDQIADERYDQEWEYQKAQDALDRAQWQQEFDYMKAQDALSRSAPVGDNDDDDNVGGTENEPPDDPTIKTNPNGYVSQAELTRQTYKEAEDLGEDSQSFEEECEDIYRREGKDEVLKALLQLYSAGELNSADFSRLYSKYRKMK